MSTVSVFPPKKPERIPTVPPMIAEMAAAQKPMRSETLAPAIEQVEHARAAAVRAEPELAARRLEDVPHLCLRVVRDQERPEDREEDEEREDADGHQRRLVPQDRRRDRAPFRERVGEGVPSTGGAPVWTGRRITPHAHSVTRGSSLK